jgi:ribosomal protein S12 methylthiotransferase accessory factor
VIQRPAFKPYLRVEIVEDEGVYLFSEWENRVLTGRLNLLVARLVDGERTTDEIVDALAADASPAEVYYALGRLQKAGHIVESGNGIPRERAALWHAIGTDPHEVEARLQATVVELAAFGPVPADAARGVLAGAGLRLGEPGDVVVALADDYLHEGLAELNARALAEGTPWLLAKPVGAVVWVGPYFRPGVTGCWECLASRLRANREVEAYVRRRNGDAARGSSSIAALDSTVEAGLALVATELARRVADAGADDAVVRTLDLLSWHAETHQLVRRPQCPACGHPAREAVPPVLSAAPKRYVDDGGHRTVSPEETVARYQHHVSPITGAVSSLIPAAGGQDDLLHVYVAGHNFALGGESLAFVKRSLRSKSAGKGASDAQAKASAICEAIERYSGVFQGDEPRRTATFRALGEQAIAPNECMRYSERQFAQRDRLNARGSQFQVVPRPFDPDAEIEWSPVWSLTREEWRYLPTRHLYFGYPGGEESFFCWGDSNGNAAGNTLEEAILQGFFELVERDGVALWWYNRLRRPAVDVASFADPYLDRVCTRYEELARPLWAIDLTSDLGIPTFAVVSRRVDKPVEDIVVAFGAHFDARIALRRAICELNQFLPAVLPMRADGSGTYAFDDPDSVAWWKTATIESEPYLLAADGPVRTLADFTDRSTQDVRDDVELCRSIVEERGMEMLVLDQTRPDLGVPVVKVIVPGLRHFWARFGPGRLYDVPVELGWLDAPTAEADLNPTAVFV